MLLFLTQTMFFFSQQWQRHFLQASYLVLLITWSIEFWDCGQLLYRCISLIYLPFIPPRLLFPFSGGRVFDLNPRAPEGSGETERQAEGYGGLERGVYRNQEKTTGAGVGATLKENAGMVAERKREGRQRFCDSRQREAVLRCQPAAPSGVVKCIRPVHWEAVKWLAALQDRS